ncbi:MAG: glutaredoxin family protein [Thermoplasmata archaeon]|jgi:glutaredoxin|nr:glutaredoxin family protein [Thermoplasmata archaeon]
MADKIKVYALSTCPYCKRTRKFLDDHKVVYELIEVDMLDDDAQDRALSEVEKLTGRQSFPVVVIGGEHWVGHDEERLRKALRL